MPSASAGVPKRSRPRSDARWLGSRGLWYHPRSCQASAPAPPRHPNPTSPPTGGFHLAQDSAHLDGRTNAVGSEARPSGRGPTRGASAAPQRRQDARCQGSPRVGPAEQRQRCQRRIARGAQCARPRGEVRGDPSQRRRAPQVAPDAPRQPGAGWRHGTAAKAARARIAASKADKAKGAQTAAGKARAALTKTTRTEGSVAAQPVEAPAPAAPKPRAAAKPAAKATTARKGPAAKTTKAAAPKAAAPKAAARKAAPKKASKA